MNKEKDHQKHLLDASIEIAEQERRRIAANLHDKIGITLNVLKINLSRLEKTGLKKDDKNEIITQSKELIDNSIDTVRAIYNDIIPPTLINLGFVKGLKEIARQLNASGTDVIFEPKEENLDFNKDKQLQLYRLVKEVLNNTVRHAKPKFIEINTEMHENNVLVSILHNGMSMTTNRIKELAGVSKGIILKSILTRAELMDANIEFTQTAQGLACVMIEVRL